MYSNIAQRFYVACSCTNPVPACAAVCHGPTPALPHQTHSSGSSSPTTASQLCSTIWRTCSANLVLFSMDWLTKWFYINHASFIGPCRTSTWGQDQAPGFLNLALCLRVQLGQSTFWAGLEEIFGWDNFPLAKAVSMKPKYFVGVAQFPWNSQQKLSKKKTPKKSSCNFEFTISTFSFSLGLPMHLSDKAKPTIRRHFCFV